MSNQLVLTDDKIRALVANYPEWIRNEFSAELAQELGEGVGMRFAQLTFRGKVWRVVDSKGVESVIKDDGGSPVNVVKMVILRGNAHFTRRYFDGPYKEGDSNPPDCWSLDNIKPDISVQNKQNPICVTCPKNAWGSKQTENGSRGKACGEYRRLAVVPEWQLSDAEPEIHLLSVPPGSLRMLKEYNDLLAKLRLNSWHLITKVGFSTDNLFELDFKPTTLLAEQFAPKIRTLKSSPVVAEVLQVEEEKVRIPGQQAVDPQEPAQAPQEPQPAPQAPPAPEPAPAPQPAPQAPQTANPTVQGQATQQQANGPAPAPAPAPTPAKGGRKQGAAIKATAPATAPSKPAADPSLGLQLGALMEGITLPGAAETGNGHAPTLEGLAEAAETGEDEQGVAEEPQTGTGLDDLEGLVSSVLKSQS